MWRRACVGVMSLEDEPQAGEDGARDLAVWGKGDLGALAGVLEMDES